MSKTKTEWISNWLVSSTDTTLCQKSSSRLSTSTLESSTTTSDYYSLKGSAALTKRSTTSLKRPKQQIKHPQTKRRLNKLDADKLTTSPVSGTLILKDWKKNESTSKSLAKRSPQFTESEVLLNSVASNYVQITDEAKRQLAKIPNLIGDYECKLCKTVFDDAFELAMHNCPRVINVEYKCSECKKTFICPANLASHKRWHRPKQQQPAEVHLPKSSPPPSNDNTYKKAKIFENLPRNYEQHNDTIEQSTSTSTTKTTPQTGEASFYSIYRNYYLAAAFAQNLRQQLQSNMLDSASNYTHHQQTINDNHYYLNSNQFTCKYCYMAFDNSLNLIFHLKKYHSDILLNFE